MVQTTLETVGLIQEQLAQPDEQLAVSGLIRAIAATEARVASAEHSVNFTRNYIPTHPGPAPHPEAGGMDHEDWNVARLEYEQYDDQAENDRAEATLRETEDKLYDLLEDKKLAESGDESVVSKYAQAERERLQAELEKQRRAQEGAERHAAWLKGAEIDGATSLSTAIEDLAINPNLGSVRGKVSTSGWKFVGIPRHGKRLMFERLTPNAADEQEHSHWKFNKTELLTLGVSDEGVSVEYAHASDIDEEGVKRYGKDVATVDKYSFEIKTDGSVAEQRHQTGKVSKWLPNHMDNGTINASLHRAGEPYAAPDVAMNADDIAKMSDKIAEVTAAMKELAEHQ